MWYAELGVVSIGADCGGPEDGGLGDIKVDLWRVLKTNCQSTYCGSVAHFALALRVGGKFVDFQPEGIEKIRRSRRERYIGADVLVPVKAWKDKTTNQLRDYLAARVREALVLCVARLKKDKEAVDETRLFDDVDVALAEFRRIDYDNAANN